MTSGEIFNSYKSITVIFAFPYMLSLLRRSCLSHLCIIGTQNQIVVVHQFQKLLERPDAHSNQLQQTVLQGGRIWIVIPTKLYFKNLPFNWVIDPIMNDNPNE